ncbi:MAG: hypothetical protein H6608_12800 [Flavobacteriales bacterium]|nr:hypothetical protein [Flavobacteriales bacterium]
MKSAKIRKNDFIKTSSPTKVQWDEAQIVIASTSNENARFDEQSRSDHQAFIRLLRGTKSGSR